MSEPIDTCLQCGQTRAQVKAQQTFCATLTGYEVVEVDQEWDRHHWRDWSNADLRAAGMPEVEWPNYRRASFYAFEAYHWSEAIKNCKHTGEIDKEGRCWLCCELVPAASSRTEKSAQ